MKTLNQTVPQGWRPRLANERCADCGAEPWQPCRVAFGKGPEGALPELTLDWAHTQRDR